ncbi:Glycosyl transferase family 2 [Musa troglodytarum]|uniref:Glycosyl transferase family 2 n=1 Tax=Musa troglodytarum TaxID=320322 RepID=A0A9E7HHR7_9LILI|nr:Glycosyl transferase family 2 [Musa troglodytarum]
MRSLWTLLALILLLVLVAAFGVAAFFLEHSRRISCRHSIDPSDAFFEDPNSLRKVPCPSIFDQAEKYLSLIIPAFNEEYRLPGAFIETINYLQRWSASDKSFPYEVLIVDDGSSDRTYKVAFDFVRKYKIENVRVLLLGRNHGKGEATRKGMLHSRGELLMLDADGATKLTDLEKLESQICTLTEKVKELYPSDQNLKFSDIEVADIVVRSRLSLQLIFFPLNS